MELTEEKRNEIGRRRFLKSLFGLGAVHDAADAEAEAATPKKKTTAGANFFWANLKNGQVGFPTGMSVPNGMPGSVMKLVTAAVLRESGIVTDHTIVECRGTVEVHHERYSCLYPHGKVDLTKAIGLSCNAFFATESQKLSPTAILDYARKFGLDTPIAGFAPPRFPDKPHKDSIPYALGLAPDLEVNALQLLRVAGLVALSGHTPAFHNASDAPRDCDRLPVVELSPNTWLILQQGMRLCGREATGTAHKIDPNDKLRGAFKTGTAPHGKTWQSWVIGYFPFDKPMYGFALRASSGTSQETAVPEARHFLLSQDWGI